MSAPARPPNTHNDHAASCHCCVNLDMGYEGDWSDVTSGRGAYTDCVAGHFYELGENDYHKMLVVFAQQCPDFTPKETKR